LNHDSLHVHEPVRPGFRIAHLPERPLGFAVGSDPVSFARFPAHDGKNPGKGEAIEWGARRTGDMDLFKAVSRFRLSKSGFFPIMGYMNTYNWYSQLIKPTWSPPSWIFGPVWSVLYIVIAVSFGRVFFMAWKQEIAFVIALPFLLNIVFNIAFTPIQFGLKNNLLAAIDIFLVLVTLVWAMVAIYSYAPWIAYAQIPYLLWVSFATVLQFNITYLNR
jgi:tryptophan-rich sensory protein